MYRTTWFSLLTAAALVPGSLSAMSGKDVRDVKKGDKEEKVQASDSSKARKTKPGPPMDEIELGKKKLKPRAVPSTPSPSARPQDDDAGEILWDTEFLVRSTIPIHSGVLVYTKY